MKHQLSSDSLLISINYLGSEVCSIKDRITGLEYLWSGNPEIWGRHSPILFPIVGKLKDNSYNVENKNFSLPQHGFARDMVFDLEHHNSNSISMILSDSEDTLNKYPYKFKLKIEYHLFGRRLTTKYYVYNNQTSDIYFSIGAHPGFSCSLFEGDIMENYYLEFNKPEKLELLPLKNGLIDNKEISFLNEETKIPLSYNLFKNDALVFANYQSEFLSLVHKEKGEIFKFNCIGFPYLGIWSKPGPFVCIEPWYGIADSVDHDGIFQNKRGIQKLQPSEVFHCEWSVEFN